MSAIAALLPDGRLHLQHGPIDCLCRAWGDPSEESAAYAQAASFFASVLDNLCAELPLLRTPLPTRPPAGEVARAMHAACTPFADRFITPMAAVAGAVADAVLAAMIQGRRLSKAFVNNGGDIAFHLAPEASLHCGLITDIATAFRPPHNPSWPGLSQPSALIRLNPDSPRTPHWPRDKLNWTNGRVGHTLPWSPPGTWPPVAANSAADNPGMPNHHENLRSRLPSQPDPNAEAPADNRAGGITPDGTFLLTASHPARGLATSGRACKGHGGRSFSFGIADSVTILARTAAQADAAATIVGNAVNLQGHPAIDRRPAAQIDPASDLGDRLITFDVGPLTGDEVNAALDAGETMVDTLLRNGLIEGAVLALHGHARICHKSPAMQEPK